MTTIGPRILNYIDQEGQKGVIHIHIEMLGATHEDLGDGEVWSDFHGTLRIESPLLSRTFNLAGEDDLNLIMRLLWVADIWIRHVCRENDIKVFKWIEGDIADDLSVFRP